MRTQKQERNGHAIAEFAMMAPVLMLLLFGVGDFGRLFYAGVAVSNAAHAGALYGARSVGNASRTDQIIQAARNDAPELAGLTVTTSRYCLCPNNSAVSCSTGNCGAAGKSRTYVSVTAQRDFRTVVRYPGIPSQTRVARTVVLRVQ